MSKIVQVYFDGVLVDCLAQTDDAGEVVCHTRDGRFVKFPPLPDGKEFDTYVDEMVAKENADESNTVVPISGEEVAAAKSELSAWQTELPEDHPRFVVNPPEE